MNIICNNNIVVVLGKTSGKVFRKGVLKTKGKKKVLQNWLDSKATSISEDTLAEKLYKTDGTYTETKTKKRNRYHKGFLDIVEKHFTK